MELLKQRIREEGIVLIVTVMQGYNVLLLLRHLALHWH